MQIDEARKRRYQKGIEVGPVSQRILTFSVDLARTGPATHGSLRSFPAKSL
jgi:hypothetical protein